MYEQILELWGTLISVPDELPLLQGEKVQYIVQNLGTFMPHLLTWLTIGSFIALTIWILFKLISLFK